MSGGDPLVAIGIVAFIVFGYVLAGGGCGVTRAVSDC